MKNLTPGDVKLPEALRCKVLETEKWLVLPVASGYRQISLKSDLSLTFLQILHYFYSIVLVCICFKIKSNILTYQLTHSAFRLEQDGCTGDKRAPVTCVL